MAHKKTIEKAQPKVISVVIPSSVTATQVQSKLTLKGPKGELTRDIRVPLFKLTVENGKITIAGEKVGLRTKMIVNTWRAHVKNMILGVTQGHEYTLKICSGHFPMSVTLKGDVLEVKNFLGEKVPRIVKIKKGAIVKVEGDKITVSSPDIELSGQVAADIEQLCRITNRDIRLFQDGIYITKKSGREAFV